MAKRPLHPTLFYRFLTWAIFPGALLHCLYITIKFRNPTYFLQRFGIFNNCVKSPNVIWCHCASVGEINTAVPLLKKLIEHGNHLLISTNTITGKQTLDSANLNNSTHIFLPLDYSSYIKRLLKGFSPTYLLVFETELWPNMILSAIRNNVPTSILNGAND